MASRWPIQACRLSFSSEDCASCRWRESVGYMAGHGVTEFWEIGAGKALTGMIRRIAKEAEARAISGPDDVRGAAGEV